MGRVGSAPAVLDRINRRRSNAPFIGDRLAPMIRCATTMITRRISDVRQCKFSRQRNLRIEIIANFVKK